MTEQFIPDQDSIFLITRETSRHLNTEAERREHNFVPSMLPRSWTIEFHQHQTTIPSRTGVELSLYPKSVLQIELIGVDPGLYQLEIGGRLTNTARPNSEGHPIFTLNSPRRTGTLYAQYCIQQQLAADEEPDFSLGLDLNIGTVRVRSPNRFPNRFEVKYHLADGTSQSEVCSPLEFQLLFNGATPLAHFECGDSLIDVDVKINGRIVSTHELRDGKKSFTHRYSGDTEGVMIPPGIDCLCMSRINCISVIPSAPTEIKVTQVALNLWNESDDLLFAWGKAFSI